MENTGAVTKFYDYKVSFSIFSIVLLTDLFSAQFLFYKTKLSRCHASVAYENDLPHDFPKVMNNNRTFCV